MSSRTAPARCDRLRSLLACQERCGVRRQQPSPRWQRCGPPAPRPEALRPVRVPHATSRQRRPGLPIPRSFRGVCPHNARPEGILARRGPTESGYHVHLHHDDVVAVVLSASALAVETSWPASGCAGSSVAVTPTTTISLRRYGAAIAHRPVHNALSKSSDSYRGS